MQTMDCNTGVQAMESESSGSKAPECSNCKTQATQHAARGRLPKALSLLAMSIVTLFGSIAEGMIAPFLPQHIDELGLDKSLWSGVIMAIAPLAVVISTPLVTCLLARSDHVGLLVWSLVLQAVAVLIFGFFGDYLAVMLVTRAAQGFGMALSCTVNFVLVASFFQELGFVNGLVELTSGAGFAFGPVVGSFMYEFGSFRLPFLACGASLGISSVLAPLLYVLAKRRHVCKHAEAHDAKESETSPEDQQDGNVFKQMWELCTMSFLFPAGVTLISNAVWGTLQGGFYSIHAVSGLGMSQSDLGLNLGASSTSMTLVSLLVGYLSDSLGHERVMVCGLFLAALSLALLGPGGLLFHELDASRWWEFAVMLLLGVGQAVTTVPGLAAMMKAVPDNAHAREVCSSLFVAFIQLGLIAGMLFSAALGSHFALGMALMASFMCCYAFMWIAVRWRSSFSRGANSLQNQSDAKSEDQPTGLTDAV